MIYDRLSHLAFFNHLTDFMDLGTGSLQIDKDTIMDDTFSKRLLWSDSQLNFKVKSDDSEKPNDGSTANAPKISQRNSSPTTVVKAVPVDACASSSRHKSDEKPGPQTDGIAQKSRSLNIKRKKINAEFRLNSKPRFQNPNLVKFKRTDFLGDNDLNYVEVVENLFTNNPYSDDNEITKILLGKAAAITSSNVSEKRQVEYFDHAVRVYMENPNASYSMTLKQELHTLQQLSENKKIAFRNKILKNLIWKMTTDQREILRKNYGGIYGDATLADDINWLYFDTVVKMYAQSENSSVRGLLKDVIAAPEKMRLAERKKALDIAHTYLTNDQIAELKKICKARHDEVVNSRNTALQVAIRENKWERVFEYVEGVLKYAPADQRMKLLEARADTDKGESQGESAFSRILINAPLDYVEKFMTSICNSQLPLAEKFEILYALRYDDYMPAFQLLAGLGYTDRVIRYIETLEKWERENDFDTKDDEQFIFYNRIQKKDFIKGGRFAAKRWLISSNMSDPKRYCEYVNAYTRAVEHGHKECAAVIKDSAKNKIQTDGGARFGIKSYRRLETPKDRSRRRKIRAIGKKGMAEKAKWDHLKIGLEEHIAEKKIEKYKEDLRKDPPRTRQEIRNSEINDILTHRAQKRDEIKKGKEFRARRRQPFLKVKSFVMSLVPAGADKSGNQAGATMAYSKLEDASEGG